MSKLLIFIYISLLSSILLASDYNLVVSDDKGVPIKIFLEGDFISSESISLDVECRDGVVGIPNIKGEKVKDGILFSIPNLYPDEIVLCESTFLHLDGVSIDLEQNDLYFVSGSGNHKVNIINEEDHFQWRDIVILPKQRKWN